MNTFTLPFNVSPSSIRISHSSKILFVGSCFSDEISKLATLHGLNAESNPFGTIFHPSPMARSIGNCIVKNSDSILLEHNKLVFDWDSSHLFYSLSESTHKKKIQSTQAKVKSHLSDKSWLFITLGTSLAYRLKDIGLIVANCHKQDQNLFSKEQISSDQMHEEWRKLLNNLYSFNKEL